MIRCGDGKPLIAQVTWLASNVRCTSLMNLLKLLTFGCATLSFAADQPPAKSPEVYDRAIHANARAQDSETAAPANSEVFDNLVIAAGKSILLDSALDYASAPTVAVALKCITCNSATTSLAAAGVVLQARWMVPNADYRVATETKSSSTFPYWDAGGVIFNVYGSQFQLILQNNGSQTLSLAQVTLFRRAQ